VPQLPDAVYLHIGHGKTGSSFLQSALALSGAALTTNGIAYPIDPRIAETARKGHITGGNLRPTPGALTQAIEAGHAGPAGRLLISSEAFFNHMLRHGEALVGEIRAAAPKADLQVLCYLRDPVDHAISVYHQQVKRGGFTGTFADSLAIYDIPARALRVLKFLDGAGARVTVLNYSRHRDTLLAAFETWLGLPERSLTAPDAGPVNRSLTNAELELQRIFNRHLGGKARRYVSDPLCNTLPHIRSETPALPRDALVAFLDRMAETLETPAFRALVPEAERPWLGSVSDHEDRFSAAPDSDALTFSAQQIEVFAEAVAKQLARIDGKVEKRAAPRNTPDRKTG
jgi:hypothetical protein